MGRHRPVVEEQGERRKDIELVLYALTECFAQAPSQRPSNANQQTLLFFPGRDTIKNGEEMKRILIVLFSTFLLSSCNGWFFQPSGYNPPTPFHPPTRTPNIVTATPVVVGAASSTPVVATSTSPVIVATDTPPALPTDTLTPQPTELVPVQSVGVQILGCNTSLDITHAMGEVTNAFVTLTNTGNVDLINVKTTLFALDEDRQHPDKTVEIAVLPAAQQVTVKLTVDSTYNAETPIQVEVSAAGGLFQRVGQASCKDIGIFAPDPATLNTPVPVNP
jgi:hypothetical protein